jgi:hypothetical protein
LADLRERGFLVFEGFLGADELAAAQEALWLHYPRPEEYFADRSAHSWLASTQWDGIITGPWRSWALNRLAFHPDLLDLAERFFGSADLRLYDAELWAKYAWAVAYDQRHHRDIRATHRARRFGGDMRPVVIELQLAAGGPVGVTVNPVVRHVAFEEGDAVPSRRQRPAQAAPQGRVAVPPRGRDRQSEHDDAHQARTPAERVTSAPKIAATCSARCR